MKRKKKKTNRDLAKDLPAEKQRAEVTTIGWMLATMACLLFQIGWLVAALLIRVTPESRALELAVGALFVAALTVSVVVLILTPIVYKFRQIPPPRPVTAFAVLVAIVPWALLVGRMLA